MKAEEQKVEFTFGNFLVTATLTTALLESDPLAEYVLGGITQKLQRKPASKVEKELAGYEKRPTGFDRATIPYTAEAATKVYAEFQKAVDGVAEIVVKEYVPGEGAEAKYTAEKKIVQGKGGDEARLAALAEKVEYEGDNLTVDNTEFLVAIRTYLRKLTSEV